VFQNLVSSDQRFGIKAREVEVENEGKHWVIRRMFV
jgi:hypothetical protein